MTVEEPTSVVVIDASHDFRWIVRRVLQRKGGFDVVGDADDAVAGLDEVRLLQPDVVLLNVDDPRIEPGDVVREMRVSCPHATVIATLSLGRGAVHDAVLAAGGAGVVRKDITLQHTFDQLWSVLATRAATQPALDLHPR